MTGLIETNWQHEKVVVRKKEKKKLRVMHLIFPPLPLTCHYLTGSNFPFAETCVVHLTPLRKPNLPLVKGRGWGKRAPGGSASQVRPCPRLLDIIFVGYDWWAGGLSRAACCDVTKATLAELWPAGCHHKALSRLNYAVCDFLKPCMRILENSYVRRSALKQVNKLLWTPR